MKKVKVIILSILIVICVLLVILLQSSKKVSVKDYKDESISFNYTSNYKIVDHSDYLELNDSTSCIFVEVKTLTSVENSNSFQSIVDNIVYEYLKENKSFKLISKYDNYPFNDKTGYRLIFEDSKNNLMSLMLITLENLNLTMVTLNSNSNQFELLIDSAELIMNTLNIKNNIKYVSLDTIYPKETFDKENELVTGTNEISFDMSDTLEHSFTLENSYNFNVKLPKNFEVDSNKNYEYRVSNDYISIYYRVEDYLSKTKYDSASGKYVSAYSSSYDYDYTPFGSMMYKNYDYYGYKKYNDKMYYVSLKKELNKYDNKEYLYYEIVEPIDANTVVSVMLVTTADSKLTSDIIENILSYKVEYNPEHSKIEDGFIVSYLKKGNIKVDYKIPEKYNIKYSYDSSKTFVDNSKNIEFEIEIISYNPFYSLGDYYTNYQLKKEENVKINEYTFERYIETYQTKFGTYYTYEYFCLKLDDSNSFWVNIKYPYSDTKYYETDWNLINDILNINIANEKNES